MDKQKRYTDAASAAAISGGIGFTLWTSYSVFNNNHVHLYAENGMIETSQAVLLMVAGIIYLATAFYDNRRDRLITAFCSLLCISFFLREIDIEKLNLPYALVVMGSGTGRNIMLVVMFSTLLIFAAINYRYHKKTVLAFLKSNAGCLLMTGGAFLWIGDFFEVYQPIEQHNVFIEEINEFIAYLLILLSSIAASSILTGKREHVNLLIGESS